MWTRWLVSAATCAAAVLLTAPPAARAESFLLSGGWQIVDRSFLTKCTLDCCPSKGAGYDNCCHTRPERLCEGYYCDYPGRGDHLCYWNTDLKRCEVGNPCRDKTSSCPSCKTRTTPTPQADKDLLPDGLWVDEEDLPVACGNKGLGEDDACEKQTRRSRCNGWYSDYPSKGGDYRCRWEDGRCRRWRKCHDGIPWYDLNDGQYAEDEPEPSPSPATSSSSGSSSSGSTARSPAPSSPFAFLSLFGTSGTSSPSQSFFTTVSNPAPAPAPRPPPSPPAPLPDCGGRGLGCDNCCESQTTSSRCVGRYANYPRHGGDHKCSWNFGTRTCSRGVKCHD